jgi:hypothetical protein
MNAVGEPCEGNPHARFDEGRGETRVMPGAPRLLYCTLGGQVGLIVCLPCSIPYPSKEGARVRADRAASIRLVAGVEVGLTRVVCKEITGR